MPTIQHTDYIADDNIDFTERDSQSVAINQELEFARLIIEETNENLFLTGKAGTGKTTFLRKLFKDSMKSMVVLAPTGVAAINAGGMTLHSFFQLPLTPFIPGKGFYGEENRYNRFSSEKKRLIKSLDLIVIDEISMVRPDIIDGIDSILRRLRHNQLPFGGVQLLMIGDLRQLPPVIKPNEWSLLSPFYASPYFFESFTLKESGFSTIELQTVYRQQDQKFLTLLNNIRDGISLAGTLKELNKRVDYTISENERSIILTTHNSTADQINSINLAKIEEETTLFESIVTGKFPEYSYPADSKLYLKTGARVMFIKNDTGYNRRYYNGMIGTVSRFGENSVFVMLDEPTDLNKPEIEIGYVDWENTSFKINDTTGKIEQKTEGKFSQIPLRLAWAITIHKSQGLTFEKAVIDGGRAFAAGQLYVALSRCRSFEGLTLKSSLASQAVIVDETINSFILRASATCPNHETIDSKRENYCRKLLMELFDFQDLNFKFLNLQRVIFDYVAPIHHELFQQYRDLEKFVTEKLDDVGNRFNALYISERQNVQNMIEHSIFKEKIKNGCRYFLENIDKLCDILNETPLTLDNKVYEKQLLKQCEELNIAIVVKKSLLQGVEETGFSVKNYLSFKAEGLLKATKSLDKKTPQKERRRRVKQSEPKEKKPKGYSLRTTLQLFNSGKSIREIAEARDFAISTITSHLCQLIELGDLSLNQILSNENLQTLHQAALPLRKEGEKLNFSQLRDATEGKIDAALLSIYYHFYK